MDNIAAHIAPFPSQSKCPQVFDPFPLPGTTVAEKQLENEARYQLSIEDPERFWAEEARKYLTWEKPFTTVLEGDFSQATNKWFSDGTLNVCYNAIDRHLKDKADKIALIWEGDERGTSATFTYQQLHDEVCKIANVLKQQGVGKGDNVVLYMPMIPELPMTMLACARLGAVHSVVFAGFSADSLRDRIVDCNSKFVVCADEGRRGGKPIKLKSAVDTAVKGLDQVKNVFVFDRAGGADIALEKGRDLWMPDLLPSASTQCEAVEVGAEDPLLILYTSGSTGKPKGVLHSTAGYALYAAMTAKNTFDLRDDDVMCCAADCGWITGHSYIVYGPLLNGVSTVVFESLPTYPDPYRYYDLIQRTKATQFYTAPTAIRALMRFDPSPIAQYDLSSLRVLGSVGEPINPEAWLWYFNHVGRGKCNVVDTYWQTETGGHLLTNLPGSTSMRPGSCSRPSFGIDVALLDPVTGRELKGNNVEGVLALKKPWPGMARTLYGDHDRFQKTYMAPYPGYYFTGDACRKDSDGHVWITGRVDDVINPSGHRIGTAELEAILNHENGVSESAVVGFPHEVKGDGICCYVVLKEGVLPTEELSNTLKDAVRRAIGPIATPDVIVYAELPKTRSGKIMRRILRKIAAGETNGASLGDTSTLADPGVVPKLIESFTALKQQRA